MTLSPMTLILGAILVAVVMLLSRVGYLIALDILKELGRREVDERLPAISRGLVKSAAGQLPYGHAEDRRDEWLNELGAIGREEDPIEMLRFAIRTWASIPGLRRELHAVPVMSKSKATESPAEGKAVHRLRTWLRHELTRGPDPGTPGHAMQQLLLAIVRIPMRVGPVIARMFASASRTLLDSVLARRELPVVIGLVGMLLVAVGVGMSSGIVLGTTVGIVMAVLADRVPLMLNRLVGRIR